jgi:hypothetical protein
MGHTPSKIPQILAIFKVIAPSLAMSHGGGALVGVVVKGAKVPGWLSSPTAYVILIYYMAYSFAWHDLYVWILGYNIWFLLYHMVELWRDLYGCFFGL